jgi:hypothetical protein
MTKRKLDTLGVTIKMGAKSQIIDTKFGELNNGVIVEFDARSPVQEFLLIENEVRSLARKYYGNNQAA